MKRYQLYVREVGEGGRWEWLCTVEAATHAEAFHRALLALGEGTAAPRSGWSRTRSRAIASHALR